MNAQQLFEQTTTRLTMAAIDERVFPGAVVGYCSPQARGILPYGRFTYAADAPAVQPDTMYDIASITKSIPTSCLALQAVESGRLQLDDSVITFVPELQNAFRERITIRHLLTYTVVFEQPQGLSGIVQLYGRDFLDQALRSPLQAPPGQRYYYTNQPALLLGLVLERLEGRPLAELAQSAFFDPLNMADTMFRPGPDRYDRIPPSESVHGQDVRGVVHDETARMMTAMGRDTGIAGVFSTAADLLTFASMLAYGGQFQGRRYFSAAMIRRMATNQLGHIHEHTGLGWEIYRPDVMGDAARDHLLIKSGHTGCIIIVDINNQTALVMLSNRMYPQRSDRAALRAYWRAVNEAFWNYVRHVPNPSVPAHH